MLRQLEAECRQHIRCEQQMKLHMECLQEKLDLMTKELVKDRNMVKTVPDETRVTHPAELQTAIDALVSQVRGMTVAA